MANDEEGKRIARAVHFPVTRDKKDASARGQETSKICRLKAHGGRTLNRMSYSELP